MKNNNNNNNNNKKENKTEENYITTVWFDKGNKVITTDITVDFSKLSIFAIRTYFKYQTV